MRYVIGLALAALGLLAASVAGAAPERAPVVQYWFKAAFGIGIDGKWFRRTGSRVEPCSQWSDEEGEFEVSVASIGAIPSGKKAASFIHPTPGVQSLGQDPAWAILYAGGGQARVHMKRTLRQTGGNTACRSEPDTRATFPPNDCGARSYISRNPLVRQDYRDSFTTLEDLLARPKKFRRRAIAIDAHAQQLLYQRCDAGLAPSFPVGVQDVALPVTPNDLSRLRGMKIGQTVRLDYRPGGGQVGGVPGGCVRRKLVDGELCLAGVDIHLDLKRVKPPSGK